MQIAQDVLTALSLVDVRLDGQLVIGQRLDRKLYVKLNDVLEACGFAWSKRAKAHITTENFAAAKAKLDRAIVLGEVETSQDIGFFPTPPTLAQQLVALAGVTLGHHALEPSAGTGRIARELYEAGAVVHVIERDLEMRDTLKFGTAGAPNGRRWSQVIDTVIDCDDFMEHQSDDWYDRIVMNPPFCKVGLGDHLDHVQHAYDNFLKPDGVLVAVLPAGVTFRQDKRHTEFRAWIAEHDGELKALPDDAFKASGTRVRTCTLRMEGRAW